MQKNHVSNAHKFLSMLNQCMTAGRPSSPRGFEILEIENYQIDVCPIMPFMSFGERHYDVNYFKKEMLWKLGADRMDDSIKQHASMWANVQNPDGSFNSNYGQYWFGEQGGFWHVVKDLARDKDSRQAVIPMLNSSHMTPETVDKVCTFGVGFRIRDDKLNMSIQMRSSDQIWGLGTDIPTFSVLFRMVYAALKSTYPELQFGRLNVTAMSSHIYARHYPMVTSILDEGLEGYEHIVMPLVSGMAEVMFLIRTKGKYTSAPKDYAFSNWLINERS